MPQDCSRSENGRPRTAIAPDELARKIMTLAEAAGALGMPLTREALHDALRWCVVEGRPEDRDRGK